jgi:hypothetical protein
MRDDLSPSPNRPFLLLGLTLSSRTFGKGKALAVPESAPILKGPTLVAPLGLVLNQVALAPAGNWPKPLPGLPELNSTRILSELLDRRRYKESF